MHWQATLDAPLSSCLLWRVLIHYNTFVSIPPATSPSGFRLQHLVLPSLPSPIPLLHSDGNFFHFIYFSKSLLAVLYLERHFSISFHTWYLSRRFRTLLVVLVCYCCNRHFSISIRTSWPDSAPLYFTLCSDNTFCILYFHAALAIWYSWFSNLTFLFHQTVWNCHLNFILIYR